MLRVNLKLSNNAGFERGLVFVDRITGKGVNWSGINLRMQVRRKPDDADPLFELSTENGGIVIDPAIEGRLVLAIGKAQAAMLKEPKYLHDLVQSVGGKSTVLWHGDIHVREGITRQ